MSKELPEDPNRWPSNPFELLGVARNASEKEIRRAFFRLAKKYKPDKDPVQFQLIHEAYEALKNNLQWQSQYDQDEEAENETYQFSQNDILDEPDEPVAPPKPAEPTKPRVIRRPIDVPDNIEPAKPSGHFSQPHSETPEIPHTTDSSSENEVPPEPEPYQQSREQTELNFVKQFWRYVAQGKFKEAKLIASKIEGNRDKQAAGFAHYFMDRVAPSRNTEENVVRRIQTLLDFVRDPNLRENAGHFLANEFINNPGLAALRSVESFVRECQNIELSAEVAQLRWKAIGQKKPVEVGMDLKSLAPHSLDYGDRWIHLISSAMEYTVWCPTPFCKSHNQTCWNWLKDDQSGVADMVELLILAAEEIKRPMTAWGTNEIARLVPLARTGFPSRMKEDWHPTAEKINSVRAEALTLLTELFDKSSIAISVFQSGMERYANFCSSKDRFNREYELIQDQVWYFLKSSLGWTDYASKRLSIVNFCIENRIHPDTFGMITDESIPDSSAFRWYDMLNADVPLTCIYHAGIACQ